MALVADLSMLILQVASQMQFLVDDLLVLLLLVAGLLTWLPVSVDFGSLALGGGRGGAFASVTSGASRFANVGSTSRGIGGMAPSGEFLVEVSKL